MLQVEKISKNFGGLLAVNDVSFTVEQGEIKALIGPNGAGKTTTFNLISGALPASGGTVKLKEQDITGLKPYQIARHGIIRTFQSVKLFSVNDFTVWENLLVGYDLRFKSSYLKGAFRTKRLREDEKEALDEAYEIAERVGLLDWLERPVSELPYGYQRLLELGRALMAKPKFLLLDEPAAGLNDSETKKLVQVLKDISQLGITILIVEHHMGLVMEVSDSIVVMNNGKKIAEGSPREIQENEEVIRAYIGEGQFDA